MSYFIQYIKLQDSEILLLQKNATIKYLWGIAPHACGALPHMVSPMDTAPVCICTSHSTGQRAWCPRTLLT